MMSRIMYWKRLLLPVLVIGMGLLVVSYWPGRTPEGQDPMLQSLVRFNQELNHALAEVVAVLENQTSAPRESLPTPGAMVQALNQQLEAMAQLKPVEAEQMVLDQMGDLVHRLSSESADPGRVAGLLIQLQRAASRLQAKHGMWLHKQAARKANWLRLAALVFLILGLACTGWAYSPLLQRLNAIRQELASLGVSQTSRASDLVDELTQMQTALHVLQARQDRLVRTVQMIANGHLDCSELLDEENDPLGRAVNHALRRVDARVQQLNELAEGNYLVEIPIHSEDDVLGSSLRRLQKVFKEIARVSREVARGNLSVAFQPRSERDQILQAFAEMIRLWQEQIARIREGVLVLANSTQEIAASVNQVGAGAAETATAVQETATTVRQVKQTADLFTQKAKMVVENSRKAVEVSQEGEQAVDRVLHEMEEIRRQMKAISANILRLSEQSQAIGEIISSVSNLAEQSNLLAVNASIEAAKAGEHGKGFTVVAQEIKSLAEQSKQATAQVRNILGDIQKAITQAVMATEQGNKAVEKGVAETSQSGQAIDALSKTVNKSASAVEQMAVAANEQLAGVAQVTEALDDIREATSQNVEGMKQVEEALEDLRRLGEELKQSVETFQVNANGVYRN